ncbi:MAG: RNA polymerase sigma factor (sigma-70 family) [Arcticibacterium sp.]|jgi:RNA polymerase sigma factor (sigma-70 family)
MSEKSQKSVSKTIGTYGNQVLGFIKSKVSNNEDAKDILQDVWVQLSRLTNIDDIESISGWLYRVARNRITDNYRKKKPDSLSDVVKENDEGDFYFKEILMADDSDNPELAMFKEVFWDELTDALAELPEKQRDAFVQNEIEDFTMQEIADKAGVSIKTIISRKGYAVKHLRQKLDYLYNELYN